MESVEAKKASSKRIPNQRNGLFQSYLEETQQLADTSCLHDQLGYQPHLEALWGLKYF